MKHVINLYGEILDLAWSETGFQYIDIEYVNNELGKLTVSPRDEVVFNIHSLGGDTAVAFAIYNKIRRFGKENKVKITTRIDGYCASAGVILLLAGDKRIGNKYAEPFVHNAWTFVVGSKNEVEKVYEELEKTDSMIAALYEERTNITKEKAMELMNADTWISAEDCLEYGFYTELENDDKPVNSEKEIIFNSLSQRKNSNKNKMTQEENSFFNKVKNLFNEKVPLKNTMLYTDKNEEVVFAEVKEGEKPNVGNTATINGKNASGTVNMADGSVYTFENGKVTEIKEKEGVIEQVTLNSLNEKLENLLTANRTLEEKITAQNSTIDELKAGQAKLTDMESTFNSLKNIVGEYGAGGPTNDPPPGPQVPEQVKKNRFENFNPKISK